VLQLHVPCMLFGVRLQGSPLAARVAANLGFAPHVQRLADRVIRALLLPVLLAHCTGRCMCLWDATARMHMR